MEFSVDLLAMLQKSWIEHCFYAFLYTRLEQVALGICHKAWNRGGGRDLTGSPKPLDGKLWA